MTPTTGFPKESRYFVLQEGIKPSLRHPLLWRRRTQYSKRFSFPAPFGGEPLTPSLKGGACAVHLVTVTLMLRGPGAV